MSGPEYTLIYWRFLDHDEAASAQFAVEALLADGWQLHGGPIAISGDRVLQALFRPSQAECDVLRDIERAAQDLEAGR